jgi:hypothetical protein
VPFPPQKPRPFSRANVEALQPRQLGCYGLFRRGEWIFVGAGDIRAQLLGHLNGDESCVLHARPTHWVDVLTDNMYEEANRLIVELEPICNRKPDHP